jgi:hypothetical protein
VPYRANYPATVQEVLAPALRFKPAALRAVQVFARSKPWRGTLARRKGKFCRLNGQLAAAYGIAEPRLEFAGVEAGTPSCRSNYRPAAHTITLAGKLSVVTYLHEFGHARGFDERRTCRWSLNLFRRCFPRSFARSRAVGHTLVRDRTRPRERRRSCAECSVS